MSPLPDPFAMVPCPCTDAGTPGQLVDHRGDAATEQYKTCKGCGDRLPVNCFNLDRGKPDGRVALCKVCRTGPRKVVRVRRWRTCAECGQGFSPRFGSDGKLVIHCSPQCGARRGAKSHAWTGDAASYEAVHHRLGGKRPPCTACGATQNLHWALNHQTCSTPQTSSRGPYSTRREDYISLCARCHRKFDLAAANVRGISQLRDLRLALGMTQGDVAAAFGRCGPAVSTWERGLHPAPPGVLPWLLAKATTDSEDAA